MSNKIQHLKEVFSDIKTICDTLDKLRNNGAIRQGANNLIVKILSMEAHTYTITNFDLPNAEVEAFVKAELERIDNEEMAAE